MPYRKHRPGFHGWGDYTSQSVGLARTMDETPFSDGSSARLIENWHVDERGFLTNNLRMMLFIPQEWRVDSDPYPKIPFSKSKSTLAMAYMRRDGEIPEIILLTKVGVYRFAPWSRNTPDPVAGLEEQFYYRRSHYSSSQVSVKPTSSPIFPPQIEVVANRLYFSFCDGGTTWVWDGHRVRNVGFEQKPSPPDAYGPGRSATNTVGAENSGGFSHRGRIGNAESNWTTECGESSGEKMNTVGGVDVGTWRYAVVYEGADGSYSAMSDPGGIVNMRMSVCQYTGDDGPANDEKKQSPDELLKRFRVSSIPRGPDNCAARVLLRTRNLQRLPPGDDGSFRFLHRIPNSVATEYIDDIPDGELGSPWQDRESFPRGPCFLKHFSGSMFYMRTEGYPSRVWWSEQESVAGPISESILFGHWFDVFPASGPITGSASTTLPGNNGPVLLVFKEHATHFIYGNYPGWQIGTLHSTAGAAGPNVIQADPAGSVVWYGSNTFWRLGPEGVEDIGATIRKRLQRINRKAAHMGVSWLDSTNREIVFWLPIDDETTPNQGFVWDYIAGGWRLVSTLKKVKATLSIPSEKLILVNAEPLQYPDVVLPPNLGGPLYWNNPAGIYVYGRSYPVADEAQSHIRPMSTYKSGWVSMAPFSPDMHAAKRGAWLVVSGEEGSNGKMSVSVYRNHDDETKATEDQELVCHHPEEEVSVYGVAEYYTDVWRSPRFYTSQVAIDAPNARTVQVELIAPTRTLLFNLYVYGPTVSGAFSRVPGGAG